MAEIKNFHSLLQAQMRLYGDKEFLFDVSCEYSLSYRELARQAASVAASLRKHGVKQGQSVAYGMHNSWQAAVVIMACLYGGFRATAINLVSGEDSIRYVLQHSECVLVLSDKDNIAILRSLCHDSRVSLKLADNLIDESAKIEVADSEVGEEDDGLLIYTSGTTAHPKGVRLSHKNLYHGGYNCVLAHKLQASDRALCSLPYYHINGFCVTLIAPFISGGSVVVDRRFSVRQFWHIIETQNCTWFSLVPTQIAYLTHDSACREFDKRKSGKVRFGRSAGSALAPDLQKRFEDKFAVKIIETMGLSETAAQILANPLPSPSEDLRESGSAGIAYGNQVIIADKQGKPVAAGVEGEIYIKGDNVMLGYFKNPQANAEAFSADGWFKSGDLAHSDTQGYIYVMGRAKELIIKGGENIAPREIDEVLLAYDGVLEAAAFAVADAAYGERVAAAVVMKDPTQANKTIATAILAHCRRHLGDFKSPDDIRFLAELPKGPSGKIQRLKLK